MRVATVLRSGGEYTPAHVQRLAAQVVQHLPGAEFFVLSDVDVPGVQVEPMQYGYPGWWAKLELMKPEIEGDLLYFDLDTTIVGDLSELAALDDWTPNADFYRPRLLQTSMGFFNEDGRARTWTEWLRLTPPHVQKQWRGDGEFMHSLWVGKCRPVQDVLPRQVVSYKVDVRSTGVVPRGTRVVCFHGQPRPWAAPELRFQ